MPPGGAVHPGAGVRVCRIPGAAVLLRGDARYRCTTHCTVWAACQVCQAVLQLVCILVLSPACGTSAEQICMAMQNMKGMFTKENEVCLSHSRHDLNGHESPSLLSGLHCKL